MHPSRYIYTFIGLGHWVGPRPEKRVPYKCNFIYSWRTEQRDDREWHGDSCTLGESGTRKAETALERCTSVRDGFTLVSHFLVNQFYDLYFTSTRVDLMFLPRTTLTVCFIG